MKRHQILSISVEENYKLKLQKCWLKPVPGKLVYGLLSIKLTMLAKAIKNSSSHYLVRDRCAAVRYNYFEIKLLVKMCFGLFKLSFIFIFEPIGIFFWPAIWHWERRLKNGLFTINLSVCVLNWFLLCWLSLGKCSLLLKWCNDHRTI